MNKIAKNNNKNNFIIHVIILSFHFLSPKKNVKIIKFSKKLSKSNDHLIVEFLTANIKFNFILNLLIPLIIAWILNASAGNGRSKNNNLKNAEKLPPQNTLKFVLSKSKSLRFSLDNHSVTGPTHPTIKTMPQPKKSQSLPIENETTQSDKNIQTLKENEFTHALKSIKEIETKRNEITEEFKLEMKEEEEESITLETPNDLETETEMNYLQNMNGMQRSCLLQISASIALKLYGNGWNSFYSKTRNKMKYKTKIYSYIFDSIKISNDKNNK